MGSKAGKHGLKERLRKLEEFETKLELAEMYIGNAVQEIERAEKIMEGKYRPAIVIINETLETALKQLEIVLVPIDQEIEAVLEKEETE